MTFMWDQPRTIRTSRDNSLPTFEPSLAGYRSEREVPGPGTVACAEPGYVCILVESYDCLRATAPIVDMQAAIES